MKHKHYDCIVAWAEGKTIQNFNDRRMCWEDVSGDPYWVDSFQYRIKPEPKPDWYKYVCIATGGGHMASWQSCSPLDANLRLGFNGETGKLKSAEVL